MANRMEELTQKLQEHRRKVSMLTKWLIEHFDHPDRQKYLADKHWHQYEAQKIEAKLRNLRAGHPEHGYGTELEDNNLNQQIKNNVTT